MADEPGTSVSIGELSRQVSHTLIKMEQLASRLEGGQFISAELFKVYREGMDREFKSFDQRLAQMEDNWKWLTRLILGFIILGLLGAFVVFGGQPK